MNYNQKIIEDIETHDVEAIEECFRNGVSPNTIFRDEPLLHELTSEYKRGPSFKRCVRAFVEYGLVYDNPPLLAVLLDDSDALDKLTQATPTLISQRFTLRCAYTPLTDATLLHVCAEFNHVECAKVLIAGGADVNVAAGVDPAGFGGQSPIFHTVNQNQNRSEAMLDLLLGLGADLSITVTGLVWGQSYPWETLIPSVNPISYAMMGLLPQMHREEVAISQIVQKLMSHRYGVGYELKNVPNAYLKG